jgi:hypothetical protein
MRDTYIPLFASTLDSSLWSLDGDCLKVFLTLALKADPEGEVTASLDGLARAAALPIPEVTQHLKRLEGPDEHSKDLDRAPANGGRRLERIAGGWRVVNIEWYREEARRQAELASKRRWWNEHGSAARRAARPTQTQTETETETQTEKETERGPERETAPAAPPPAALAAPKPKRRPRTIKTLLPDDFAPNAEHATIARERGLNLGEVFAGFRDWCAENGAQKADWQATFRNWLRRERAPHGAARGPSGGRSRNSDALDYVFDVATGKA